MNIMFPMENLRTFVLGISGGDCAGKKEMIQYRFDRGPEGWVVKGSAERELQPRAETREPQHDGEFKLKFLWMRIRAGRNWRKVRPPERRLFRRSGYIDIFEGCGGVLVRPDFFDEQVFDIPPEAWSVDDIWLSACLARRDVPIWLVAHLFSPPNTDAQAQAPLAEAMIDGLKRSKANQAAVRYAKDHFGIWI